MSNARPTQSLTIHSPSSAEFRRNYPHFGTALSHGNGVLVDLVWNSSALRRMEARTAEGRAALEAIMPSSRRYSAIMRRVRMPLTKPVDSPAGCGVRSAPWCAR